MERGGERVAVVPRQFGLFPVPVGGALEELHQLLGTPGVVSHRQFIGHPPRLAID
jgi:hypothetical protein